MRGTILIVSKTKMRNSVCIGGIVEETCEFIRIHNERGGNLPIDAPYEIGDRWVMDYQTAWNVRPAPHMEDKETTPIQKVNNVGLNGIIYFVKKYYKNFGNRFSYGRIDNAFEGTLHFEGYKSYINRTFVPSFSTQFWVSDTDLIYRQSFGKDYYLYSNKYLKYVGLQPIVNYIPAGTIIRLSLANWWNGDGSEEDRSYLQLSGWYL